MKWEQQFSWLRYDEDSEGAFCQICSHVYTGRSLQHTGGVWVGKNWKKAVEKMKAHEKSVVHIRSSQAMLLASTEGSVVPKLQRIGVIVHLYPFLLSKLKFAKSQGGQS